MRLLQRSARSRAPLRPGSPIARILDVADANHTQLPTLPVNPSRLRPKGAVPLSAARTQCGVFQTRIRVHAYPRAMRIAFSRRPKPTLGDGEPSAPNVPVDASLFLEQARWLLEWHDRRAQGFHTRAGSLLGFSGVILALLLQAVTRLPHTTSGCAKAVTVGLVTLSVTLLLGTATLALWTLMPGASSVPEEAQLRRWWLSYYRNPTPYNGGAQLAHSFLDQEKSTAQSAVAAAMSAADKRAIRFAWTVRFALAAIVSTGLLALNVLYLTWGA